MFYELTDLLLQKTPEEIAKENKPPLCRPRHRTCCEQSRELIWDTFEKPETSFLGMFLTSLFQRIKMFGKSDSNFRSICFFRGIKLSTNPIFRGIKLSMYPIFVGFNILVFVESNLSVNRKIGHFSQNVTKLRLSTSFRYFLSYCPSAVSVWRQFHLLKKIIAT